MYAMNSCSCWTSAWRASCFRSACVKRVVSESTSYSQGTPFFAQCLQEGRWPSHCHSVSFVSLGLLQVCLLLRQGSTYLGFLSLASGTRDGYLLPSVSQNRRFQWILRPATGQIRSWTGLRLFSSRLLLCEKLQNWSFFHFLARY